MRQWKTAAMATISMIALCLSGASAHAALGDPIELGPGAVEEEFADAQYSDPSPIGVDEHGRVIEEAPSQGSNRDRDKLETSAYVPSGAARVPLGRKKEADLITPNTVIGADGRYRVTATRDFPHRAIVYIERNGRAHCTGWMASADTLVTAGHCLYDVRNKSWYSGLKFYPGADGASKPFGYATASQRWTDTSYIQSGNVGQDWGIVKLNRALGDQTGWFGIKTQTTPYDGESVTIKGYPGDKPAAQMWGMSDTIRTSKTNQLCYSIDTVGGQSGAPVYLPSTSQVIAIHAYGVGYTGSNYCTGSQNGATRITKSLYGIIISKQ